MCVCVFLIMLHVDHLPLCNWDCAQTGRWCMRRGPCLLLLHNMFSCPCSHVTLWNAKAGRQKFLQRRAYTMSGRVWQCPIEPPWQVPMLAFHGGSSQLCSRFTGPCTCWGLCLSLGVYPRAGGSQMPKPSCLHPSKPSWCAPCRGWNSFPVVWRVFSRWLLVWFLIFMPCGGNFPPFSVIDKDRGGLL